MGQLIFTVELLLEVRRGKYLSSIIALSRQPKDNLHLVTDRHQALKARGRGEVGGGGGWVTSYIWHSTDVRAE